MSICSFGTEGGMNMDRTERISKMEKSFDAAEKVISELRRALVEYSEAQQMISELYDYYGGGDWMLDYEADSAGLLPHDLKRGVLSEDGMFNMMSDNRELLSEMKELAERLLD